MGKEPLVLCVDQDAGFLRLCKLELESQGFRVKTCSSVGETEELIAQEKPDVLVVEHYNFTKDFSQIAKEIALIFCSDYESTEHLVRGLEIADDYLTKPISHDVLGARIRAVLRRVPPTKPLGQVKCGELVIDLGKRIVTKKGKVVPLTRTEWLLLQYLAANCGAGMLSADLLAKVWGPQYRSDLPYLRVWVSRLRGKIEENPKEPKIIKCVYGIGYMLEGETVGE